MRKHYDEYGDSEWACGGDGDCIDPIDEGDLSNA